MKNRKEKKPRLTPKMKQAVTSSYKLGILEGERRCAYRLNILNKINRHLMDEIVRLDKVKPVDSIAISVAIGRKDQG